MCRVIQLNCSGELQTFSIVASSIPPECSITKISCLSLQSLGECFTMQFGCKSQEGCNYEYNEYPCWNGCVQTAQQNACICPVDRTGDYCDIIRKYSCALNEVRLTHDCDVPPSLPPVQQYHARLDADRLDLLCKQSSKLEFTVTLDCNFQTGDYSREKVEASNFTYVVIGDKFASSDGNWTLMLKVFNFQVFSDLGGSILVPLSKDQVLGFAPITFTLDISQLDPSKYLVGNRLWAEYKFWNDNPVDTRHSLGRKLCDIIDLPPIGSFSSSFPLTSVVFGIVLALVILGLVGLAVYKCRKSYFKKIN